MRNEITKKILFVLVLLVLSIISNGQYAVFFAPWILTSLLLFAVRKLKKWQGFLLAWLIIGLVYHIGFDNAPFLPLSVKITIALIFGLFNSMPYLIDSFFSKKRSSFLSTLIFPTVAVLLEYAYVHINKYGSWGHLAYSQQTQYFLIQSISVFGMGYITFLITWFAAVSNWVYEQKHELKKVRYGALIYGLVLGLTFIYGAYRVQFQKANSETIRVASISAHDELKNFNVDLNELKENVPSNAAKVSFRETTSRLNQDLIDRSIKEANAGAKIVFWAEGNSVILKEDEAQFYDEASKIAAEQNIYLGLGLAVLDPNSENPVENKFVLFDQSGEKAINYWKNITVPGLEGETSEENKNGILRTESPYGTIAAAICFDLDFPQYMKQARNTDIFLAPSNDWKEIDPIHTSMAKFRAIEQGFNLIRQTSLGLSAGNDYTGKVISEMDHFKDNGKIMVTHLPTKGVSTIYSIIGDTFIVLCLIMLIGIIIFLRKPQLETNK